MECEEETVDSRHNVQLLSNNHDVRMLEPEKFNEKKTGK